MMVTLVGAMSTAEIGKIFAEMIRDKVQIISCTANLEEDIMNLLLSHYERVPNYRDLTPTRMGFT
jgi:deoxyhypusine synthase